MGSVLLGLGLRLQVFPLGAVSVVSIPVKSPGIAGKVCLLSWAIPDPSSLGA